MEKNIGFATGSAQPSAPPPSAPPSYEEAVANAPGISYQPINITPYPVGGTSMPMPVPYSQLPNQATGPLSPNCARPKDPPLQSQPQHNANTNFVPTPAVQIIHQHVTYALSRNPVKMSCPTCHANIKTTTILDHQPSAHICCVVLCLLGCCLCSCLPYCMNAFMSVHHFCPNCKNYIGTWKG